MIVLAMSAAVVLGGGELLVSEAAVSALLLASIEPSNSGYSPDRFLEALTGGAVAMAVGSLFFPPDPTLIVGRAAQSVFRDLGETLEGVAAALAEADPERAEAALARARAIDADLRDLEEALSTAREMLRFAPPRRGARGLLERYSRTLPHLDFAVRNTRVLARHALRYTRARLVAPDRLVDAVRELAQAVWSLAAAHDDPQRAAEARDIARAAPPAHAREAFEQEPDLAPDRDHQPGALGGRRRDARRRGHRRRAPSGRRAADRGDARLAAPGAGAGAPRHRTHRRTLAAAAPRQTPSLDALAADRRRGDRGRATGSARDGPGVARVQQGVDVVVAQALARGAQLRHEVAAPRRRVDGAEDAERQRPGGQDAQAGQREGQRRVLAGGVVDDQASSPTSSTRATPQRRRRRRGRRRSSWSRPKRIGWPCTSWMRLTAAAFLSCSASNAPSLKTGQFW